MYVVNKFTKGFTLIELLVVIAVLGVLAAGVFTAINPLKRIQQANDAKIKNDISQIAQAEQAYFTSSSSTGAPYYAVTPGTLATSRDLKVVPVPPGSTAYIITGKNAAGTACTAIDCADITVSAPLNETGQGFWCWESKTGKTGRVELTPGAQGAAVDACGTFL